MFTKQQLTAWRELDFEFDGFYDSVAVEEKKEEEKVIESKNQNSNRYDYLPIVKINNTEEAKNAIISFTECKNCKKDKINLGQEYDEDKQEYIVAEIVITQNSITKIPLTIRKGSDLAGFDDEDGVLKFSCNNGAVKYKFIESDDTDYKNNENSYDINDSEYGDDFVLEIEPTKLARGTKFSITVFASDDDDSIISDKKNSTRKGICGKFNFTVIQSDVFTNEEIQIGLKELSIISEKHKKRPKIGEYSVNYCIQAADRFLGAIVKNQKLFYAYDDVNEKKINAPNLSNAIMRAQKIKDLGYGKSLKNFAGKVFTLKEIDKTDEYENNPTRKIFLKNNDEINEYFDNEISNKLGFHIFYLSIVEAFHTLILIIDNSEPCQASYQILDEDGLTSSQGNLKEIGVGLTQQSQWVYIWAKPKFNYWAKLDITLLKFKRKE
jgi:hypothetical protein